MTDRQTTAVKCARTGRDVDPDIRILPKAKEKRLTCPNHDCCTVEYQNL